LQDVRAFAYNTVVNQMNTLGRLLHPDETFLLSRQVNLANNIARSGVRAQAHTAEYLKEIIPPDALILPASLAAHLQMVPTADVLPPKANPGDYFRGWHAVKSSDLAIRGALQGILLRAAGMGVMRSSDQASMQMPDVTVTDLAGAQRINPTQFDLAILNYAPSADFKRVRAMMATAGVKSVVFGSEFSTEQADLRHPSSRYWTSDNVTATQFAKECLPGGHLSDLSRLQAVSKKSEARPEAWQPEHTTGKLPIHQIPLSIIMSRVKTNPATVSTWLRESFPYTLHTYAGATEDDTPIFCFEWKALEAAEKRYGRREDSGQIFFDRVVTGKDDQSYERQSYCYDFLRHRVGQSKVAEPQRPRIRTSEISEEPFLE